MKCEAMEIGVCNKCWWIFLEAMWERIVKDIDERIIKGFSQDSVLKQLTTPKGEQNGSKESI